jgi:hypothetical protein
MKVIRAYEDKGIATADIRLHIRQWLKGQPINDHTLKRVLFKLRQEERIETRNGKWFPVGAETPGVVRTQPQSFIQPFKYPR